ncbi:uncharacterized protein LOC122079394 [Macadamia integrifolia]|uniref:uncharacterized protein LOC122079394 n=1 Tax=Macadamia integrifolia TaxID=60698 RepID=UPI001C4FF8E5|nr:uncharacterized protein LOC122079394 [Macadamia integrifolia]
MGSSQSIQEGEEEEEEEEGDNGETKRREVGNPWMKKVLEQEPEMLPCHASASPLSPQLSTVGTPHLGPSIKVWDPCNVLAPPPPLPPRPAFSRSFSSDTLDDDRTIMEVFLISHGECGANLRPDLIAGRWPEASLTPNGKRQARALAVFLKSHGLRFNAVYSSPLDRARTTAVSVCQELDFAEEQIQSSDALIDMSQGQWEGYVRSEVYTPEMLSLIDRLQPDFSAPSGESLREVEFRMIQFLNSMVLRLHERLRTGDFLSLHQNESKGFSVHNSLGQVNSVQDWDGPVLPPPHWDLLHRHKQGLTRKKSGKSRLQFVTKTEDHEAEDEVSPHEATNQDQLHEISVRSSSSSSSYCIGVFTHAVPIKCLITSLLGCSPAMSERICIDDSSVTVLQHSIKTGWQIKRLNDTAHLRLL